MNTTILVTFWGQVSLAEQPLQKWMKINWKEIRILKLFLWRVRWAVLAIVGWLWVLLAQWKGFCLIGPLASRILTSWTPSQAMEQFLIAFCSTDSFLLDWLVHPNPITGGFSCSYFSNLHHGPLLASALLGGSPLGRFWGDTFRSMRTLIGFVANIWLIDWPRLLLD